MLGAYRVRATLLACTLAASAWACASIWGFQPGTEESEGGADASAPTEEPGLDSVLDVSLDTDATIRPDAINDSPPERLDSESASDATADSFAEGHSDSTLDAAQDAAADVASDAVRAMDSATDSSPASDAGCSAVCIPSIPANWGGPYAIYEGTGGPPPPTPPSCQGSYPNAVYDGTGAPNAPAANCTCTCGTPTGAACLPPVANYFTDSACSMSCGQTNQSIPSTCTNLDPCSGGLLTFSAPIPSGGSCAPDAGSAIPSPGWTADVRLCGAANPPTGGGCDAGQVCAPTAAFPLEAATYCIAQSGSVPCPPAYPAVRTYYQSSTDTRACSPCSCGSPAGVACSTNSIAVYVYSLAGCGGAVWAYGAPQSCVNTGGASAVFVGTSSPSGGMCSPMGGAPIGSFTPTTPTTICCTR